MSCCANGVMHSWRDSVFKKRSATQCTNRFLLGYATSSQRPRNWATHENWRVQCDTNSSSHSTTPHQLLRDKSSASQDKDSSSDMRVGSSLKAPIPARDGTLSLFTSDTLPSRIVVDSPFTTRHLLSYGIAACAADTGRWLLVRPTTSPNFSSLVRGFYRVSDIGNMVRYITREEWSELYACCLVDGEQERERAFRALYLTKFPIKTSEDESDFAYALERFEQCRLSIRYSLENCPVQDHPEIDWTWPKGRRNGPEESALDAAMREFYEETGLDAKDLIVVTREPIGEFYRSNNGRIYETQCWVALLPREVQPPPVIEVGEISDRRWFSADELRSLFTSDDAGTPLGQSSRLAHFESLVAALSDSQNCETVTNETEEVNK